MSPPRVPDPARRRRAALALIVAVAAIHLWVADRELPAWLGRHGDRPRPIAVAFVHQLKPQAPPQAPARPPRPKAPPPRLQRLAPAALPASAPPLLAPLEIAVEQASDLPALPPLVALLPPAAAASAPAFEWPPSTRLSYRVQGDYRGPVEGQAEVQWLHEGKRYQVFMDLSIGASFAPLMRRVVDSEGVITAQGLSPSRYDEETRVVFRDPRRYSIRLDDDRIVLPGGASVPRPEGVQDSASQFVQLTWLFITQPALLQTGRSITLPLALARSVEPWIYDVLGSETLYTPAGPIDTVHVKPRREPQPGVSLTAEIWVAPSLQYLPVRILIHQDQQTWVDLRISKLPEQAAK
ncbi:MAG: DUF3108 domain-containing protein [Burkholderiales bacterium]|nr:DUF3108 domain-containing protein [Burkholderiales bacterium]